MEMTEYDGISNPGFALMHYPDGSWGYRAVRSDWVLVSGETFYPNIEDFPQEAKDWFVANSPFGWP